jgi:hypothetical protein
MNAIRRRPMEAATSAENAQSALPAAAWKTLRVSHSSHRPYGDDERLIQPSTEPGEPQGATLDCLLARDIR